MTFREAVCLRRGARTARSARAGSYTPPPLARRATRAAASVPRPPTRTRAAVVEVEVDPVTGWIAVPRVWIAHDIGRALNPVLVRGQVEGSVYMGLGEALMEEQVFRRLPREAVARARAQVPVDARVQEPDDARHARGRAPSSIEDPDPRGPFGAKEVGQGPLLPIMPARRQRGLRRRRRAHRRGPDHAREDPARRSTTRRKGGAGRVRARRVSRDRLARAARRAAAVGGRRRPRDERARAQARREARRTAGPAMMRLPRFRYLAPRDASARRRGSSPARARTRCCSPAAPTCLPNMKRRQQMPQTLVVAARHRRAAPRCDERRGAARSAPGSR